MDICKIGEYARTAVREVFAAGDVFEAERNEPNAQRVEDFRIGAQNVRGASECVRESTQKDVYDTASQNVPVRILP